jgi:RNA polymerase sigma-70 factor (ECF subfamily)
VVDDFDLLVQQVTEGDFAAFETIYDAFHRLVYAVAYQVLGTESGAEDVTQSVFLTVWTAPHRFRGGSFRRWIAAVARNRALDVLRARKPELPLTDVERTLSATDGMHDVVNRIDAARARDALAALPPAQRAPIELAFFGGLTHDEIATRTATPLGTVKSRIRTGLRSLRVALETGVAG